MNLNSILGIDEEAEREAKEAKDAEVRPFICPGCRCHIS